MCYEDIEVEYVILSCENLQIPIGGKTCTYITLKGKNKVWLYVETIILSTLEIQRKRENAPFSNQKHSIEKSGFQLGFIIEYG